MPDLNDLLRMKGCLKKTKIKVSREDGTVEEEERAEDGYFDVIFVDDGQGNGANRFRPSNRMLQQRWGGMILDLKPDLQVACVTEGVFLSSQDVAQDLELLLRHGITHVVNVATGVRCFFPNKITYLALTAYDLPTENLKRHFEAATEFMRKAVEEEKGKVLVHCNAGISRSTSIVLAYIMRFERMPLGMALTNVRKHRPIARPNDGFMRQLEEYEHELGIIKELAEK